MTTDFHYLLGAQFHTPGLLASVELGLNTSFAGFLLAICSGLLVGAVIGAGEKTCSSGALLGGLLAVYIATMMILVDCPLLPSAAFFLSGIAGGAGGAALPLGARLRRYLDLRRFVPRPPEKP